MNATFFISPSVTVAFSFSFSLTMESMASILEAGKMNICCRLWCWGLDSLSLVHSLSSKSFYQDSPKHTFILGIALYWPLVYFLNERTANILPNFPAAQFAQAHTSHTLDCLSSVHSCLVLWRACVFCSSTWT